MPSPSDSKSDNVPGRTSHPLYQPLVIILVAACVGILIDAYWPQAIITWCTAGLAALCIWYLLTKRGYSRAAAVIIFVPIITLSGAWHHYNWNLFDENDLGNYAGVKKQPVALDAFVISAPRALLPPQSGDMQSRRDDPSCRIDISGSAIRDAGDWKPISGRALLYVQGNMPPVKAGDCIRIVGDLSLPGTARNPGEFDRAAYMRGHRIRALIQSQSECISIVRPGGWNITGWLDGLRKSAAALFEQQLDTRQAELASAVFLGERELIDSERNEAFMVTGTIHILSISGVHVGILAGAILFVVRWFPIPRIIGLALVASITGLYALMVDVEPPVVRATILVLVACSSLFLRRKALSFNSLAAAALVVLAINPSDLFNVGAQLSFLCVAVLMWAWPLSSPIRDSQARLQKMIDANMNGFSRLSWQLRSYIWDLSLMGAMIWIVTQPLVAARFHLYSPIALVLNVILWLPMTLALLSGYAFLFLAMIVPPLAGVAAWCCNFNLWFLEKGIAIASSVPGSHFWAPGPNNWWLVGFYGGLFALAVFPKIRPSARWCCALLIGWTALGYAASFMHHDSSRLRCTFLSVGHGSATVLELPSGKTVLYDAGQFSAPMRAARIISGTLWSRGITHIDAVVVSHPDIDHYNALPELLEKCSIGAVYVSPAMFEKNLSTVKALRSALDNANVPVRIINAGDQLESDADCRLEVLNPPETIIRGNDNANSIVLAVEYYGHRIILPGDLESPGLDNLLAGQPMHCDVLLAPHHGSQQSNSPGLAAWCRPTWVILSGDGRWTIPEIDATYQAVGSQTLHTFLTGAIEVTIDKSGTTVETFSEKDEKE